MSELEGMVAEALAPLFERRLALMQERSYLARRLFSLGEDVPQEWLGSPVDPLRDWREAKQAARAAIDVVSDGGEDRP